MPRLDAERWRQVNALLDAALDRDPAEWPTFLAVACADDVDLRREVDSLLAQYGRHHELLATGAGVVAAEWLSDRATSTAEAQQTDQLIGARLGPWRIGRSLGSGGMARVFLGERDDGEFAQRVAVKVLRAGLDDPEDVARFRAERRILAALDHPNIARLLDGGVAPDGRPYLVIEYVDGEPLTDFCERRALSVPERLRLFVSVAEAVQAAHRQLVVHRDLKPSNILVDADARPRLLDFGIARILEGHDDGEVVATTRRRWLTPGYAAPEQFNGGPITTATDVYQLGCVLKELLPPEVSGDLDAVIKRATRPEPEARYASVADLADDVRRVLDGAPVAARNGDRAYRWRRAVRRRAVPLAMAAIASIAATAYVVTVAQQNRRIARALATATAEQQKAVQATDLLLGLFRSADGGAPMGDSVTARALLARAEAQADAMTGAPEPQAALLTIIGQLRFELGAFDAAKPTLERALAIRRRVLSDSHPDVSATIALLAAVDDRAGRYAAAARSYRDALTRQRVTLGDTAIATQQTRFGLAAALHSDAPRRQPNQAFADWKRVDSTRAQGTDAGDSDELLRRAQLADYTAQMRGGSAADSLYAAAERDYRQSLAIRVSLFGPRHNEVTAVQGLLGVMLGRLGRNDESAQLIDASVSTLRSLYPQGHQDLASTLLSQGQSRLRLGDAAGAVASSGEALVMARQHVGEGHRLFPPFLLVHGDALRQTGDVSAAVPLLREAVERLTNPSADPNDLVLANARAKYGDALSIAGRYDDAERQLKQAYDAISSTRAVSDRRVQGIVRLLMMHYDRAGRPVDAARFRALLAAPLG